MRGNGQSPPERNQRTHGLQSRLSGPIPGASQPPPTAAVLDAGLRAYMLRVYNWMASGLLLTGIVAYVIANTSLIDAFYPLVQTPAAWRVHASRRWR